MRRVVLPVAGFVVGVTVLLSLKSAPGATRAPERSEAERRTEPPVASAPPAAAAPESTPSPSPTSSPSPGYTYTGDGAYTEFGYVTVQITVANGRMVDAIALEMPADEARSVALSARVAPILRERALAAQSADFDTVSGATWTSEAYKQSLQSALAKAGRA
jgi:uncharacterized protein with FMN-binding domain